MFQGAIYNLNHKNHSNTNGQARNEPRPCSLRWLGGTEVTTSILEVTQTLKGTAGADSLTFTHPSNLRFLSSQAPSRQLNPSPHVGWLRKQQDAPRPSCCEANLGLRVAAHLSQEATDLLWGRMGLGEGTKRTRRERRQWPLPSSCCEPISRPFPLAASLPRRQSPFPTNGAGLPSMGRDFRPHRPAPKQSPSRAGVNQRAETRFELMESHNFRRRSSNLTISVFEGFPLFTGASAPRSQLGELWGHGLESPVCACVRRLGGGNHQES